MATSVIIAVYNRIKYLGYSIKSVLDQTDQDLEIIVVDDGSPIDPGPVVNSFDDRVRLVRKSNGGPASARNFGIANARGKYLLFLDDDDFLEPMAIETLREAIKSSPGAAWAVGRFSYADEEGRRLARVPRCSCGAGDVYSALISQNVIGAQSTVLLDADAVRSVGAFDERFTMAEDYDLWLTLARDYPIVAIGEVVTNYRMHGNQSSSRWELHYEHILRVLQKHRERARPGFEPAFDASIASVYFRYGDDLYYQGRPIEARERWRRSHSMRGTTGSRLALRITKSYIPPALANLARKTKARLTGK
jgi:glycosyltransferase involved in cell wall biosynthesis